MSYMQNSLAFTGGVQELSFDEIEVVSGGSVNAPPGSPLLGINPYILDCFENLWYGRSNGGGGLWFEPWAPGMYSAWDANGDWVAMYEETTQENATRTISSTRSAGFDSTSSQSTGTVYLRPAG